MVDNVQNFKFHAGDVRKLRFTVYKEDPLNPGKPDLNNPVDLTGATIKWALANFKTDAAPLFTKSTGSGITIVAPATNGVFDVALDKADTVNLNGKLFHEAEVVEASGDDSTVATGTVTVEATVID